MSLEMGVHPTWIPRSRASLVRFRGCNIMGAPALRKECEEVLYSNRNSLPYPILNPFEKVFAKIY